MNNFNRHTLGKNKRFCTGCAACAATCPVEAITMQPDEEGFLQPNIDLSICTDCEQCREICPVNRQKTNGHATVKQDTNGQFPTVWAAWNLNEDIRRKSSSGGVFSALAENVLSKGGVVVGAAFDEQLVLRHRIIDSVADLHKLRGSKYVQSQISPSLYKNIDNLLKKKRIVLFSGTPCQVAGVQNILNKLYDNFYCCDLACMGVPSQLLFQKFLIWEVGQTGNKISKIKFRDKRTGWKSSSLTIHHENGKVESSKHNPYQIAFLKRVALRPSCYECIFKGIRRYGDISLADFWGVSKKYPQYDQDDKGTSLVFINNDKGKELLEDCRSKLFLGSADIDSAVANNPMIVRPAQRPQERDGFYNDLMVLTFNNLIRKYRLHGPSLHQRALGFLKRKIKQTLLLFFYLGQKKGKKI